MDGSLKHLIMFALILAAPNATAALADPGRVANNTDRPHDAVQTAPPSHAAVGAYGLARYGATGPASAVPVDGVTVSLVPTYYYVPAIYTPVFIDATSFHFGLAGYWAYGPGHFRFPYYSYRRPWYFPGLPVFNRNTGLVW
ncbi:MAG TPA: hypothetical protein EYP14_16715 [Planctomycetaceae bacterium]|nr:hypothetical protein [Planctomycetaceae bacterium]